MEIGVRNDQLNLLCLEPRIFTVFLCSVCIHVYVCVGYWDFQAGKSLEMFQKGGKFVRKNYRVFENRFVGTRLFIYQDVEMFAFFEAEMFLSMLFKLNAHKSLDGIVYGRED